MKKKRAGDAADLGDWLRVLRKQSLKLSQEMLAQKLGIKRSTVSAWENGTYKPSVEILNKLGNELNYPECLSVWEAAGIKTVKLQWASAPRAQEGPIIDVPLMQASDSRDGGAEVGSFSLPSALVRVPGSTVCVRLSGSMNFFPFSNGEIAVVDKSETDAWTLEKQLVAVHFKRFPNLLDIPPNVGLPRRTTAPFDLRRYKLLEKLNPGWSSAAISDSSPDVDIEEAFAYKHPGLQIGWVLFQRENQGQQLPEDGERWRFMLQGAAIEEIGHGFSIPLTEWQEKSKWWQGQPAHPKAPLIEGRTILGRVTCWMRGAGLWKVEGESEEEPTPSAPQPTRRRRK